VLEVADAAFAAGAPLDESAEGWSLFVLAAGGAGGAFTRDRDALDVYRSKTRSRALKCAFVLCEIDE
jgi:hypothetical protein